MRRIFRKVLFAGFLVVIVLNWTWGRLPAEPPPPAGSKYAEVGPAKAQYDADPEAPGIKIHYVETPGKGPGVILIHGHPGTYLDWGYVQAKLQGLRTVAIDRPGYGYSSGGYVAFDDQVKAIHDLAAKLGMRKPVIAGHSYGGTLAVAYALRYPNQTKAIVPVDPAVDPDGMKPLDLVQAQFVKALQVPIVRPIANATFNQVLLTVTSGPQVKQAFSPNPVNPDYTQQLKAVNLKSSDLKTFADEALDFNAPAQLVPQFNLITTPAWVVQGMQDKLVSPASVKTMAHELPHARYIQLSGGHMQTWVHPNQVANAIRSASR